MKTVETLTDEEFKIFFDWLPERVKSCVHSGMVDWKKVLPEWYNKFIKEN